MHESPTDSYEDYYLITQNFKKKQTKVRTYNLLLWSLILNTLTSKNGIYPIQSALYQLRHRYKGNATLR